MLVLRLLVMVLTIICLMDGHAEVSSSTTGMRKGGESPAVKQNEPKVQILDRKKKKKPKPGKKKKPKPGKNKKPKPNKAKPTTTKPVTTTPTMSTSTPKMTTILTTPPITTTTTTTTTVSPTTTETTAKITTSTASATTTLPTTTSATTTVEPSSTASTTTSTIPTTATTSSQPTTAATTADSGAGGECKATNGKPCIFPFKDGKEEYNECKNKGGRYFWCATSVYDSGKYKHWSYCSEDGPCPLEGDGECRATNNKPCVFPFKDGKKEYNECADHGGQYFWCATGTNSAGKYTAWEKCPKDGSCPLPQKSTAPAMPSRVTPASTTPLITGTTAATDQMKGKVLDTLENLVLGESRDDSLQMAHMLYKELDIVIKDLEGEKSKSEQSNSGRIKLSQDVRVRGGTELGEGLMFDLSTVDSMKSLSRVSDDCCKDCKNKHSDTELAEYWNKLDACFCYKKKINQDRTEVVPQTWTSSEFTTKTCEPSGCGYNSDVDPDRLLAEQNSAYLLDVMATTKYTEVFEVLNWNLGFSNPSINQKLFEDLENKKRISSGYYMMFLAPASVSCDKSVLDKTQKSLLPIHVNQFSNIKNAKEFLDTIVNTMDGKAPEWMNIVYQEMSSHVCMALQTTYFLVAMNRVQTLTTVFNFAFESERYLDKFYPLKECSTKELTITAMKNIAKVNDGDVIFDRSVIELYEWEALLPVVLTKKYVNNDVKTIVFVETETQTADENDFISYKGPVVFNKGQNKAVTFFHINGDEVDEIIESFSVTLKEYGTNVKIFLKESPSARMQTRNKDLPTSLTKLMTGSIRVIGTTWGFKGGLTPNMDDYYATGIDANKLQNLNKVYFTDNTINLGIFEGLVIEKQDPKSNKHDVVVFRTELTHMNEFDDIDTSGQTIFVGGITALFMDKGSWPKTATLKRKYVTYLPWMKGTITMRKLTGDLEYALTAQIDGCGVRIFTITGSQGYDGNYMSHDNSLGVPAVGCPDNPTFASRLVEADIIQRETQIVISATVYPSDIWIPQKAGISYYTSSFKAFYDQQKYLLGKSTAIAIKKPQEDKWCLVLQRNIKVYYANNLHIHVKNTIFGHDNAIFTIDPTNNLFSGEYYKGEEILVTRPLRHNGQKHIYGYEMICDHNQVGTFHDVDPAPNQPIYWAMTAKIVKLNTDFKVFVIDNAAFNRQPKLQDLFNFIPSTPFGML